MQALAEYNAGICECGMHKSVADNDPDMEMVQRRCPACVNLAKNLRTIHAEDDRALRVLGENPPADAMRPVDGRYLALRMKPASVALAAE